MWARALYLAEITEELVLTTKPFEGDPCPPQGDPRWVMHYAASLTRLLAHMPELSVIHQNLYNPLEREVLGYALYAFSAPTRIQLIHLIESSRRDAVPAEALQPNPPSFFAMAMAGQLPELESLTLTDEWEFLAEEPNLGLVMNAILLGYLPELSSLSFTQGSMFSHLAKAFSRRSFMDPFLSPFSSSQCMMKRLSILPPMPNQQEAGSLADLLTLPVFGSLVDLLLGRDDDVDDETAQGRALAAYLRQPGGRPSLKWLHVAGEQMSPLTKALAEFCVPNLNGLDIIGGNSVIFHRLRTIYEAGALAYLRELSFHESVLDPEAILAWMEAVIGSEHKGGALKILKFESGREEDEQDGRRCALALLGGVRRGAYPNVEEFDTRTMLGSFFHLTDETIVDYIDALGDDFPCSETLESFSVRRTGSGAVVTRLLELRVLLGGAEIVCVDT